MGMISNCASHPQPAFWKHYSDFYFCKTAYLIRFVTRGKVEFSLQQFMDGVAARLATV
jgi:hypothetical protein